MILKNIPVFQINLPSVSNQSSQCFNEYLQEAEKKGEALFPYLFYPLIYFHAACRRNSAQITAVAMATFRDSDVSWPAG